MDKKGSIRWFMLMASILLVLSAMTYFLFYLIFQDTEFIFRYLIIDLAFVPIEVILVTMVLDQLIGRREKMERRQKLNMIIGAFFSDIGTELLKIFVQFDPKAAEFSQKLVIRESWSEKDFFRIKAELEEEKINVKTDKVYLLELAKFLNDKREHLMRLLENPQLMEHESFSQLIWAILHLAEELGYRQDLYNLPDSDYAHLGNDIKRAYILLIKEWLNYLQHLSIYYSYLFSLAIRTNPFNSQANVKIQEN